MIRIETNFQNRVKLGQIRTSIDWVSSNDYETVSNVFAEINFVKEVVLWSDKCSLKDLQKMETDYNRDLVKSRYTTKASINNYIKDTGKLPEKEDEEDEDAEKPKETEINTEATISLNPKLNIAIAPGFAKQIEKNINLIEFKLVYYKLHT